MKKMSTEEANLEAIKLAMKFAKEARKMIKIWYSPDALFIDLPRGEEKGIYATMIRKIDPKTNKIVLEEYHDAFMAVDLFPKEIEEAVIEKFRDLIRDAQRVQVEGNIYKGDKEMPRRMIPTSEEEPCVKTIKVARIEPYIDNLAKVIVEKYWKNSIDPETLEREYKVSALEIS